MARKRRQAILLELAQNQAVRVSDLTERFGVSEVSIRRDLASLEREGALRRLRGGAVAGVEATGERIADPEPVTPHLEEKERIGRAAAGLVKAGERLFFDSGSTALAVARHIPPHLRASGNLTVITGSLTIVRELGQSNGIQMILLGGVYLPHYEVTVGPQAINQLRSLHADRIFVGTDGVSFTDGVTTANVLEAEVDRAAIAASREVVVVSDSSKIGRVGLITIASLDGIHKLITDTRAPEEFVNELRGRGVEVILA